jgi:GDP-L-fucose synthase
LGRHLQTALAARGDAVTAFGSRDCDLRDPNSLKEIASDTYDHIYHLAAWTQAGDFCLRHAGEQWIINQQINTNVLSWWLKRQPAAKLICTGTSCSYPAEFELSEENYLLGAPIESLFTYAMTKRMLYAGLLALHKQFGLTYLHVIPSTLFGPGYHTDGRQMHFIFDLIRKIVRGKLRSEPVILWGDGYQKREVVLVDDFVRVMVHLSAFHENDSVNIGAGSELSIREIAQMICEMVGYNFDAIAFDTSRYVGAKSKCLVTRKLKQLVPDLQLTPLQAGLSMTIEWVLRHEESLGSEAAVSREGRG